MTNNKNNALTRLEQEVVTDLEQNPYTRVENIGGRRLMPTKLRMEVNRDGNLSKLTASDGSAIDNPEHQRLLTDSSDLDAGAEDYLNNLEEFQTDLTDDPTILEDVRKDISKDVTAFLAEAQEIREQDAAFLARYEGVEVFMKVEDRLLELGFVEPDQNCRYQLSFEPTPLMKQRFDRTLRRLHEGNVAATMRSWASLPYGSMVKYVIHEPGDGKPQSSDNEVAFLSAVKPDLSKYTPQDIMDIVYRTQILNLARLVRGVYRVAVSKIDSDVQQRVRYLSVENDYTPPKRVELSQEATKAVQEAYRVTSEKLLMGPLTSDKNDLFRISKSYDERGDLVQCVKEGFQGWHYLRARYPDHHVWHVIDPQNGAKGSHHNGEVVFECEVLDLKAILDTYNLNLKGQRSANSRDEDSTEIKVVAYVPKETNIYILEDDMKDDERITSMYPNVTLYGRRC
jgi:hypothetical protein